MAREQETKSKGKLIGHKNRKKGKRRPLRRETLVRAARETLTLWSGLSPDAYPINISRLAKELGVTRQAIYDNGLSKDVIEYKALQQRNSSIRTEAVMRRRPLEERISLLEKEVISLRRMLDGWIERWAEVEYNARMLGIDADKIFAPIPLARR